MKNPSTRTHVVRCLLVLLAGTAITMTACRSGQKSAKSKRQPNAALASGAIVIDGAFTDWPADTATIADPDWVYFRVMVEGQSMPLQASTDSLVLLLDADGSTATGVVMSNPPEASNLGVDLLIEYSPQNTATPGRGVQVTALTGPGASQPLSHDQIGLVSLPTCSSETFEIRVSRHIDPAVSPGLSAAMSSRGSARGMFVLKDSSGKLVGWSDPETFTKPAVSAAAPLSDEIVPAKAPGTIRVVSYNVLKSKLMTEPNSFARLFQVLDADVLLIQEWDADPATATAWFTAVVNGQHPWYALSEGSDVAIVSPYPITPLTSEAITIQGSNGNPETVRAVDGIVSTPAGDIAVTSVHLKCCGTAGSSEDTKRLAQAKAINSALRSAFSPAGAPLVRVIGGDFNLVGTRAPLDAMCAGIDTDGSDLGVAMPVVLGDTAVYTWNDPQSEFPAGRLDFLVFSDASAQAVNAFVIDTSRLSMKALARMGLDARDSSASDHLPVVVDLKPR